MAGWNLSFRIVEWGPQGEEEEGRKEYARRASREATEDHGKPIYENSGESQMEVTPE